MEESKMSTEEKTESTKLQSHLNNLIMSLSSLIFQADNYHMHILSKIQTQCQDKGRDPADHAIAPPLQLWGNFEVGKENIPPLLLFCLQPYPTVKLTSLSLLFVAVLSNRMNEPRGRRWERQSETEGKKCTEYSITKQDRGGSNVFLVDVAVQMCRTDANRMCEYRPVNQINHLF